MGAAATCRHYVSNALGVGEVGVADRILHALTTSHLVEAGYFLFFRYTNRQLIHALVIHDMNIS